MEEQSGINRSIVLLKVDIPSAMQFKR